LNPDFGEGRQELMRLSEKRFVLVLIALSLLITIAIFSTFPEHEEGSYLNPDQIFGILCGSVLVWAIIVSLLFMHFGRLYCPNCGHWFAGRKKDYHMGGEWQCRFFDHEWKNKYARRY